MLHTIFLLGISFKVYKSFPTLHHIFSKNSIRICDNCTKPTISVDLASIPFVFSQSRNIFLVVVCIAFASLKSPNGTVIGGCMYVCEKNMFHTNANRFGSITMGSNARDLVALTNEALYQISTVDCKYAFPVEEKWLEGNLTNPFEIQKEIHIFLIDVQVNYFS